MHRDNIGYFQREYLYKRDLQWETFERYVAADLPGKFLLFT